MRRDRGHDHDRAHGREGMRQSQRCDQDQKHNRDKHEVGEKVASEHSASANSGECFDGKISEIKRHKAA